jgi:hypothetical protein
MRPILVGLIGAFVLIQCITGDRLRMAATMAYGAPPGATTANNTVRGTVLSASEGRLTINSAGSYDQVTVLVAPQTKLALDGKVATLDQFKAGDRAHVTFEGRDRELVATSIIAWSPF